MNRTTVPALALLAATAVALAGCASDPEPAARPSSEPSDRSSGHGEVEGAQEVAEPPAHLVTVDADGQVGLLDLLSEEQSTLGSIGAPRALASDGRFAFVTTDAGVEVVDSGAWTWDHGDHFHFYRASPGLPGTIEGDGDATITTPPLATAGGTGVFFSGSGDAVLVDMEALSTGEVSERFRIATDATAGLVAPVGDSAIVALADGAQADLARVLDASGEETGVSETCVEPSGSIVTRVGTVVGCADGALLAVASGEEVAIERIPYPDGVDASRAEAFDGRKNRPAVAALAGDAGFWLLDTRAREWIHADVDAELVRVVAASDDDENIVALDADGRVRVFGPDGAERASSDPLVSDPSAAGVSLVVDAQRAYVGAPEDGIVYEIAYADDARVARELSPDVAPDFSTEAGR